jgi:hypothetical protein
MYQRGTVLILSLVFAAMLALVAATVVQTATQQLHMAGNDQFRTFMRQYAQSVAAALAKNQHNFQLDKWVGHVNCPVASGHSDCDSRALPVPNVKVDIGTLAYDYRVVRLAPFVSTLLRSSAQDEKHTGGAAFATFEIEVRVTSGAASVRVVQGVAVEMDRPTTLYRTHWREPGVDPL